MYLTGKIDRSETVIITDDFLRTKDVFEVDNEFYVCTEIINEEKKLFGVLVSTFDTFPKQKEFHFHEVIERYFKKWSGNTLKQLVSSPPIAPK